jgi:hypothetical protein
MPARPSKPRKDSSHWLLLSESEPGRQILADLEAEFGNPEQIYVENDMLKTYTRAAQYRVINRIRQRMQKAEKERGNG